MVPAVLYVPFMCCAVLSYCAVLCCGPVARCVPTVVFGRVLEGLDVVDKLQNLPTDRSGRPGQRVVSRTVLCGPECYFSWVYLARCRRDMSLTCQALAGSQHMQPLAHPFCRPG